MRPLELACEQGLLGVGGGMGKEEPTPEQISTEMNHGVPMM